MTVTHLCGGKSINFSCRCVALVCNRKSHQNHYSCKTTIDYCSIYEGIPLSLLTQKLKSMEHQMGQKSDKKPTSIPLHTG